MSGLTEHARLQARLAEALRRHDAGAPAAELGVDADGFRVTALLVARLRFERLVQGSRDMAERFERSPAELVERFRSYHRATPMSAESPAAEAACFAAWERDVHGAR